MISTVSILGVDDSVSPEDLADISQKYPFVEWGVNLCSGTGQIVSLIDALLQHRTDGQLPANILQLDGEIF